MLVIRGKSENPRDRNLFVRLWSCLTLSLALHGVVVFSSLGGIAGSAGTASAGASRLEARLILSAEASRLPDGTTLPLPSESFPREIPSEEVSQERLAEDPPLSPRRATGLPFASEPYFHRSELTEPPAVLSDVDIAAPPLKRHLRWIIRLRIYLSIAGAVDRIQIEESTAPGHIETEVVEAFRTARYSPGKIHGGAVKSQLIVEIEEQ